MRYFARLVFVLYVLAVIVFAQEKKETKPVVSEKQKLEIREQQVKVYQAKEVLEATPQFRAFMQTQNQMNELSLQVQREIGCIPPNWQITQDLECIAVVPPPPTSNGKGGVENIPPPEKK